MPTLPNAQSVAEPARSPARTRALLALSAGLGGVLLAQLAGLDHPSLLYTLAVALSGASLATPGHAGRVVLLVAIACVGGGRMAAELAPPADHLVHRLSALPHDDAGRQRGLVRLTAVVTHSPINPDVGLPRYERGVFQGARSTLLADASSLDMIQAEDAAGVRGISADTAREAAQLEADSQCARWLRRIEPLATIGNLAPLVGLAGTVWGMILAFTTIGAEGGAAGPAQLSLGISKALFHTLLGLCLAVPALLAYGILRSRVDRLCDQATSRTTPLVERVAHRIGEQTSDAQPVQPDPGKAPKP